MELERIKKVRSFRYAPESTLVNPQVWWGFFGFKVFADSPHSPLWIAGTSVRAAYLDMARHRHRRPVHLVSVTAACASGYKLILLVVMIEIRVPASIRIVGGMARPRSTTRLVTMLAPRWMPSLTASLTGSRFTTPMPP